MTNETLTQQSTMVKRRKNPVAVFARFLIYPLCAYGLWRHDMHILAIAAGLEIVTWAVVPPVERTLPWIERIAELELTWLHAPRTAMKWLSWALAAAFPSLAISGIWLHSLPVIGAACAVLAAFLAIMRRIAAKSV